MVSDVKSQIHRIPCVRMTFFNSLISYFILKCSCISSLNSITTVVNKTAKDATMFDEDELIDEEEFEHLLYNQVYHSSVNTEIVAIKEQDSLHYNQVYRSSENTEIVSSTSVDEEIMNFGTGRYFYNEATGRNSHTPLGRGTSNFNSYNFAIDPRNQLLNSGFSVPHMLVSPINNIVVVSNPPTQVFVNNKVPNRRKRGKRKKKKFFETNNSNLTVATSKGKGDARKTEETCVETIHLSDSNDSDVCYIEVKAPLVVVSSDDESKTKPKSAVCDEKIDPKKDSNLVDTADSDVIFVPIKPKEIETITIEEETINLPEGTIPVCQTPEHIPPFQKEILGTPESTMSNDFLDGTPELSQNKFNFGLHGVDFNTKELNKPLSKPAIEKSETESSASDTSSLIKTAVFNEVPFESPTKNIFNENNLQTFADFIVPKRTQAASTPKSKVDHSENLYSKTQTTVSSDSSSESDYEETNMTRKTHLPNLSLFEENFEDTTLKLTDNLSRLSTPTTSTACVKESLSDIEESKVNAMGIKQIKDESSIMEPSYVYSPKNNEEKEDICVVSSADSDNSSNFNMDSFETVDEVFAEEKNNRKSTTTSEESDFDLDELERLDEDLQIVNCKDLTLNEKHEPRDKSIQQSAYSFDALWTEDKEKFYKESWGHENFSVALVQKTMSDDPNLWKIIDADKQYSYMLSPKKRIRCRKCRNNHNISQCPKLKQPVCFLCGFPGHSEPRCPHKVCTMCGRRSDYATTFCSICSQNRYHFCRLCKMQGHLETRCPDLWRRYFLTTKEGPLIRPEGPEIKNQSQLYCCGCGKVGHLEHTCVYFNRTHPPVNPLVCQYEDVYAEKCDKSTQQQEEDLRNRLQNKGRKWNEAGRDKNHKEADVQESKKSRLDDVAFERQILLTEDQNFDHIFDRNKDLAATNVSVNSFLNTEVCDDSNSERQKVNSIFDRNKDLVDTNKSAGSKFSFMNAVNSYINKMKTSKLVINPFVTSNLEQQKIPPETETSTRHLPNVDTVFNGFESDVTNVAPREIVSLTDSLPTNVKDMKFFLRNAFRKIRACRNLNIAEIWKELKKEEKNFNKKPCKQLHQAIKSLYERIHIILFGIHKLQEGADAYKVLRNWENHVNRKEFKAAIMPKYALDDIGIAYNYIFGKSKRDINYELFIQKIRQKMHFIHYAKQTIHKDYDFFKRNSKGTGYKKLHALYAKVKSGQGDISLYAEKFKTTFGAFRSTMRHNKNKQKD